MPREEEIAHQWQESRPDVSRSLVLGAAAQHAFEEAEASGMASESTCWAEAADAVMKEVRPDVVYLLDEVERLRGLLGQIEKAAKHVDHGHVAMVVKVTTLFHEGIKRAT